jgi:hypothetical protein
LELEEEQRFVFHFEADLSPLAEVKAAAFDCNDVSNVWLTGCTSHFVVQERWRVFERI